MSKRTLFILIGVLIVLPLVLSRFFSPTRSIVGWFSSLSTPTSAYSFKPAEIERRLKGIEAELPQIEALIAEHRYQGARERFDVTFAALRRSQHDAGNTALDGNRTLGGELDRLEARVGATARRHLDRQLAEIAQGGPDTSTVHRLLRSFEVLGGNKLAVEFAARAPTLDKQRRTFASRWIRIRADAPNDDYEAMTVSSVVQHLVVPAGFTVVYGPPMGPAEDEATFATLSLKVVPEIQDYVKVRKGAPANWADSFYHDRSSLGLLARLAVVIKVRPAFREYGTSWDHLPTQSGDAKMMGGDLVIDLSIPTPATFEIPPGREARDEFKERNVARVDQMKTKLAATLAGLAPLDFVPMRNPAPPPLSRQAALMDEAGFIGAASAALAAKKSVGPIACIAVELMIEPLADRIEPQLDKLTRDESFLLIRSLAARPWYHQFGTASKLLLVAPPDAVVVLITALKRDFDQEPLRKATLARILREKPAYQQDQMMQALIDGYPAEALTELARLYPTVPAALQSVILTAMMKRDRAMAGAFAVQLMAPGKPDVAAQVSAAVASALVTINSGRTMTLLPDETTVFIHAVVMTRGPQREKIVHDLPDSEELLVEFLQADRSAWTEAENLELYGCFNGALPYNAARGAAITGAVFASVRQGRINTMPLAQKASHVLSSIANQMLRTRGDESVKIPLILQVIDERSKLANEVCDQSIRSMIASLQLPGVLAHPDARKLLTKGKTHPDEHARKKILELTIEAAKADPAYRDLL